MIRQSNLAGLVGAKVVDRDGDKIGTVGRIYVDPSTGRANWAAVRMGLFGSSETFLPLQEADEDGDVIRVPYEKGFVKDAPRIDDDAELTHEEEDELYAYYDSLLPRAGGPEVATVSGTDAAPAPSTTDLDRDRDRDLDRDLDRDRDRDLDGPAGYRETVAGDDGAAPAAVAPADGVEPRSERRLRKHVLEDDGGEAVNRGSVRVEPATDAETRA